MSFAPILWATFCDDVRQEVGNKLSFLGIYGPQLIVPSFPADLLKLCCVFSIRVPATTPPREVIFRVVMDDAVLFEHQLSLAEQATASDQPIERGNPDVIATTISTVAQLVNLPLTRHGLLKARAVVDGLELKGGSLELVAAG